MALVQRLPDTRIATALQLLQQGGGTPRTLESWNHDHMTALLLGDPAAPVALMPLARRTIRSAPGAGAPNIAAGWLTSNQFATRMSWRRQTRETASEWPRLLPELDVLLVIRRDDRGPSGWGLAARWYQQTGFSDVLPIRCLYLDMDAPPAEPGAPQYHVQLLTPSQDAWQHWQPHMLAVYNDVYATSGGMPLRHADYWAPALAHHYYKEHYQFQIIGLWSSTPPSPGASPDASMLMGYAVVGWSGWHSKRPRMDILELATRQWDTAVAASLIRTTCQLAWSKNVRQVRAVISAHDPYRGHLMRTGFQDRWGYMMMAKWLHAQRYLERLKAPAEAGDPALALQAPGEMPLRFRSGTAVREEHLVQTDPATLTRLLLNRADVAAAHTEGLLRTATPLSEGDIARLSMVFPWTPWVFHMLDYI